MVDFFLGVGQFLVSIVNLIVMLISGVFDLLGIIPKGMLYLTTAISYAPSPLIPFMMVTVTVSVILFIVGRRVD